MNSALRTILNVNYDNFHMPLLGTNRMFLKLNLLKLKEIFQYFMTKFIHSCIHGKNYLIFQEHFEQYLPSLTYKKLKIELSMLKTRSRKTPANI